MNETLLKIQAELKSPKLQVNTFGKYNYRSCEDILEAVKPLCVKYNAVLRLSDDIIEVGGRIYVKATAAITGIDGGGTMTATAYAREAEIKKGMDESQITGAASSYARKYALNGLFLIDDTKDADATNNHEPEKEKGNHIEAMKFIDKCKTDEQIGKFLSLRKVKDWTDEELKEQDSKIEGMRNGTAK